VQNSAPQYASAEIERLNEYVTAGGDLGSYFDSRFRGGIDLDQLDVETKSDQELIVREYFRLQEAPDDEIGKRIDRYDETGILEDEAGNALKYLKKHSQKESEKLLVEQQKVQERNIKEQQKLYQDVLSNIKKKEEILGMPVNQKQRDQLVKAIFDVDKTGVSGLQKAYNEDPIESLILSAYVSLYKDELGKKIERKAGSDAARNMKRKLENNKKGKKIQNLGGRESGNLSKNTDLFASVGRNISKPN